MKKTRKVKFRYVGDPDPDLESMLMEPVPATELIRHLRRAIREHGRSVHVRLDSGYNNICVNYLRPTRGLGLEFAMTRRKR